MVWVIVVLACLFLAIKFRGFRYALAVILGLLTLAVAIYVSRLHENEENSKHLVQPDQLVFTDMHLGPSNYGSSYVLTGRVQNNSQDTVFDVVAQIRILDCDAQEHCDVVGEEKTFDMVPLLPPGQARDINSDVFFGSGTQIHGKFEWNYEITEIRARSGN
jgi:hypothetical protein